MSQATEKPRSNPPDQPAFNEAQSAPQLEPPERFSITDYLIVNGLFLGFLVVMYLLVRVLFRDSGGLLFFFVVLGLGFIAVSIYDYLFDRLYHKPEQQG